MNSPVLRGPGELLAAVPILIGFTPRESVVAVSIRPDSSIGVVLRVDRADCLDPTAEPALGRGVATHLARDGARLAVLVSFTAEDVRLGCPAASALRAAVLSAVDDAECWAVTDGRYFAPGCADPGCCPAGGRPLPAAPHVAGMVREPFHDPRGALSPEYPDAERRRAQAAGARWWGRRTRGVDAWRVESFRRWRGALAQLANGTPPDALVAGRLAAALADRRVRDAVLVGAIPGWLKEAEAIAAGEVDDAAGPLAAMLDADEGHRPLRVDLEPTVELCREVTGFARRSARAPMHTIRAVLAWWAGDDDQCRRLLEAAHAAEPGYRLAGLLECAVLAGIAPGWQRAA